MLAPSGYFVQVHSEAAICCLDCANHSTVEDLFEHGRAHCPRCGSGNWHLIEPREGTSLELRPEGVPLQ